MPTINYSILFDASQAKAALASFSSQLSNTVRAGASGIGNPFSGLTRGAQSAIGSVGNLGTSFLSLKGIVTGAAAAFAKETVDAARQAEAAFKGLESVANGTGVGIAKAWKAVQDLTADGVLSQTQAATAMKNLMAFGITDAEKAVQIIGRLKDAAAFGRQAGLAWGEAIVGATEGIKNENSALVDNAGITKNVAKIYEEYAETLGVTYASMTQGQKIQAIYLGIMKETELQAGDTGKALQGGAGSASQLSKAYSDLKEKIGKELDPAFQDLEKAGASLLSNVLNPMVEWAGVFTRVLASPVQILKDTVQAFKEAESFGEFDQKIRQKANERSAVIANKLGNALGYNMPPIPQSGGYTIPPLSSNKTGIPVVAPLPFPAAKFGDKEKQAIAQRAKEKADEEEKALAKQQMGKTEKEVARLKQSNADELNIFKAGQDAQKALLEANLASNSITRAEYAKKNAQLELDAIIKEEEMRAIGTKKLLAAAEQAEKAGDTEKLAEIKAQLTSEVAATEAAAEKAKALRIRAGSEATQAAKQDAKDLEQMGEQMMRARINAEKATAEAIRERDLAELEGLHEDKLISEEEYLRRVGELKDKALAEDIARLEQELEYTKSKRAANPVEASANAAKAVELEGQIQATEEKRVALVADTNSKIRRSAIETARLRKDLEQQLLEAEGLAYEARTAMVDSWLEDKRRELAAYPEMIAKAEAIAAAQKKQATFDDTQEKIGAINADYQRQQSAIDRAQRRGLLDDIAYEKQSLDLKKKQADALRERLELLKQSANESTGQKEAIADLEEQIATLDDSFSELAQSINDNLFERVNTGFKDLFGIILSGGKGAMDVLKRIVADTAGELASMFLKNGLQQAFAGLGMTGGGGFGGAVMSLFGGFRAAGGDTQAGQAYVVGEKGPELWFSGANGRVVSNAQIQAALASMSGTRIASPVPSASKFSGVQGANVTTNVSPKVFVSTGEILAGLREDPAFERHVVDVAVANGRKIQGRW